MREIAENDPESLNELIDLYLQQTAEQFRSMKAALRSKSWAEMRQVAHCCAGASSNCGMDRFVDLLRQLEQAAERGSAEDTEQAWQGAEAEMRRVCRFLTDHKAATGSLNKNP
jgi:HPt (histidine-containing phosphotransfer) domain-containing protein